MIFSEQKTENRKQKKQHDAIHYSLFTIHLSSGFTLIETLVAVSLLSVAVVAPMALTSKSLAAAYYARDQITAFHLSQEAIESVRHARDHNVLQNALGEQADLLAGIPSGGNAFTIDTRDDTMTLCPPEGCPPLLTDGELYGYATGWEPTRFTRTVRAEFVAGTSDEVIIRVRVDWRTGVFQSRYIEITENLYRWVNDGSST